MPLSTRAQEALSQSYAAVEHVLNLARRLSPISDAVTLGYQLFFFAVHDLSHFGRTLFHALSLIAAVASLGWEGWAFYHKTAKRRQKDDRWMRTIRAARASHQSSNAPPQPQTRTDQLQAPLLDDSVIEHVTEAQPAWVIEPRSRHLDESDEEDVYFFHGNLLMSNIIRRLQVTCLEAQIVLAARTAEDAGPGAYAFLLYPLLLHALDVLIDVRPTLGAGYRLWLRLGIFAFLHVTPATAVLIIVWVRGASALEVAEMFMGLLLLNVPYLFHVRQAERPAVMRWRNVAQAALRHHRSQEQLMAESETDEEEEARKTEGAGRLQVKVDVAAPVPEADEEQFHEAREEFQEE